MHGQFIWYELSTPDVDAAKKFYPRFTDWGTQPFDNDYTMWTTGGVPMAGIFRLTDEMRQQGVPPNWMPYVESSDVDETTRKATSLGGQLVAGPSDIPNVGRYAVVQDPQGARFGVYKSINQSRAWDGTNIVGRFSWHELMTTDAAKAFDFYGALFGWEKTGEMDMGGGEMYTMYGKAGKMYGGIFNRPPEMAGMHPFWLVYIHVKDVGEAVARATKAGGTVKRPRMDIPGGTIAILGDPQGAGFALHDVTPEAAAAKTTAKSAGNKVAKSAGKKVAKSAGKKVAKSPAKKAAKSAVKKAATKATKRSAKSASKKTKPSKAAARFRAKGKAPGTAKAKAGRRSKTTAARKAATKSKAGRRAAAKKGRAKSAKRMRR